MVKIICKTCKGVSEKQAGHINRRKKAGQKYFFCSRKCSGLSARSERTLEEKKKLKSEYDKLYRHKNKERLKKRNAEYHQRTYYERWDFHYQKRQERMKAHLEYCRRPEYRKLKSEYDKQYLAKKKYGELWESAILINQIDKEVKKRMSNYEIKLANKTLNKTLQRSRNENTKRSYT